MKPLLHIFFGVMFFVVVGSNLSAQEDITRLDTIQQQDTSNIVDKRTISKKETGLDLPVDYSAQDSSVLLLDEHKLFLYNKAKIIYGDIQLEADYIEFNLDSSQLYASGFPDSTGTIQGKPVFKQNKDSYQTSEIWYNFKSKKALIKGIVTEQSDGYLHGNIVKMQPSGDTHILGGKYTTCDLEHPHFYINLTRAIVKADKKIVSGPLYFVVEDVPLFPIGLPFGFFPSVKGRGSGFIMPTYGEEVRRGFFLRGGGYYFAVNDNLDIALTTEIYSKGTYGLNLNSGYIKRYRYKGDIKLEYKTMVESEKGLEDYNKQNSFHIRWNHSQAKEANPYSKFSASVNFETNNYSEKNARTHRERQNSNKSSSIGFTKSFPNAPINLTANLKASQNTQTNIVDMSLPVVNLNTNNIYPFRGKFSSSETKWYEDISVKYSSNFTNKVRTADSVLFENKTLENFKTGYKHSIPVGLSIKIPRVHFLTISPRFNYTGVFNTKYIEKRWDFENDTSTQKSLVIDTVQGIKYAHQYNAGISLSLTQQFTGMYQFKPKWLKSRISAVRHVITPTASFSYSPPSLVDDTKFRKQVQTDTSGRMTEYDIFSNVGAYGSPSSSRKQASVNFSLANNLEMKVRNSKDTTSEFKKVKILERLNFSTSYNVFKDSLNWSNLSFTGSTNILQKIKINFSGAFNPYAYNEETGTNINQLFYNAGQKFRLSNVNVRFGLNFKSKTDHKGNKVNDLDRGGGLYDSYTGEYIDFNIPWSFSINYSIGFRQQFDRYRKDFKYVRNESAQFSTNLSLTPQWKMSLSSSYDFKAKKLISTRIGINRPLHCWQMEFSWIPSGTLEQYNFRIAISSSVFDGVEYKIDKRNGY